MEDRIPEMGAVRNRKAGNKGILKKIFTEES
jgi:hypothetical protein